MVYLGSKAKYSQYIVPILQNKIDESGTDTYIECFVGGGNVIDKINCKHKYGYDRSDTLIALLTQMRDDFDGVLKDGNRELWDKEKAYVKDSIMPDDMTLAEIGAMEFFASFSNGGFPRGYAKNTDGRNYFNEAYRNAERQAPNLKGIEFGCQNYWELDPNTSGAVIYLDSPYAGTKQYGYARQGKFDFEKYYDWCREIAKHNYVFISEQQMPDDFEIIWEQECKRTAGKDNTFKAVERLFRYKEGLK